MRYLYKITNTMNNKIYIGQTVNPSQRWWQHRNAASKNHPSMIIARAIKKYGNNAFDFEIIAQCQTLDDANFMEEHLIQQYDSRNPEKGYNIRPGGNNSPITEITRQKISVTMLNRTPEEKKSIYSLVSDKLTGHEVSMETKQKISEALIGHPPPTNGFKTGSVPWSKGTKGVLKPNSGSFTKGHIAPSTAFQKGLIPWNKRLDQEYILIMKNNGISVKEIAAQLNCHEGTIYNILRKIKRNQVVKE